MQAGGLHHKRDSLPRTPLVGSAWLLGFSQAGCHRRATGRRLLYWASSSLQSRTRRVVFGRVAHGDKKAGLEDERRFRCRSRWVQGALLSDSRGSGAPPLNQIQRIDTPAPCGLARLLVRASARRRAGACVDGGRVRAPGAVARAVGARGGFRADAAQQRLRAARGAYRRAARPGGVRPFGRLRRDGHQRRQHGRPRHARGAPARRRPPQRAVRSGAGAAAGRRRRGAAAPRRRRLRRSQRLLHRPGGARRIASPPAAVDETRADVGVLEKLERRGLVQHNDVLRARLAVETARSARRSAEATLDTALAELSTLTGADVAAGALVDPGPAALVEPTDAAIEASPLMVDARAATEAARRDADAARSDRREQVTFTADAGFLGVTPTTPSRTSAARSSCSASRSRCSTAAC